MKYLFILSFLIFNIFAMDIDYKTLETIIQKNPNAIKEKVLLAKYYMKQSNDLKAMTLLDEVLEKQPKNQTALQIKTRIQKQESLKNVFREAGLSRPIQAKDAQKRLDSYYDANNYQFYSTLYQSLVDINIKLRDSYHIKAAYIYLHDTRYKYSKKAIDRLKQKNNLDSAKINADICYYTGKYRCSAKAYEKLYASNYELSIGIKLAHSYVYLKDIAKAQRVYNFLHRKYPNNKKVIKLGGDIRTLKKDYISKLRKDYEEHKNLDTLKVYANALYSSGKINGTLALLDDYNQENATNQSMILEAKYLIWSDRTEDALNILRDGSLVSDLQTKLMLGQIYSWQQQFYKAKINLDEVIKKASNKNLLFEAKKARAFIYMWEKHNYLAKKLFKKLQKQKPSDFEIKEALLELNHQYKRLIKIYKNRVKKNSSSTDIKRLSELYSLNKQPIMALKYLKLYVKRNPNNLGVTKELALLLIDNKKYYEGFGYLEYYAIEKDSAKSKLLLAKYYYWNGFDKEALDVLNSMLKEGVSFKDDLPSLANTGNYRKKAIKLKAQILKVSPRFIFNKSGEKIGKYFNNLSQKQLFLADTLYFNGHYKASITYYENYLKTKPTDNKARYRYAFALENAKEYAKAEGEFSLIFNGKDSNELKYHYAYNMMKNNKLQKSKKLLLELKNSIYEKINPKLDRFLESWKTAWEARNFEVYALYYDKKISDDEIWSFKKQDRFSRLKDVLIDIKDARFKKIAANKYKIHFFQIYSAKKNDTKGYKTLFVRCDENQTRCKITKETWRASKYKKTLLFMPYIDKSLKENEYLIAHPIALKSKKKSLLLS